MQIRPIGRQNLSSLVMAFQLYQDDSPQLEPDLVSARCSRRLMTSRPALIEISPGLPLPHIATLKVTKVEPGSTDKHTPRAQLLSHTHRSRRAEFLVSVIMISSSPQAIFKRPPSLSTIADSFKAAIR
jgi:hypothetical protein